MQLATTPKAHVAKPVPTSDFERLVRELDSQIEKANRAARVAVDEAIAAGAMLAEARERLKAAAGEQWNSHAKPDSLKFEVFIEGVAQRHGCSTRTLYNWMGAAENGRKVLAESNIRVQEIPIPLSRLLTLPEAEVGLAGSAALEARQLLFNWMADKTIGECLKGVVVDGDDASRITRAHNGKTKGGSRGEDRKAFDEFIGRKLSDISSHLEHWETFKASQKEATLNHFANALSEWDTVVLEHIQKLLKEEMKKR
jgi:hypothetical protein